MRTVQSLVVALGGLGLAASLSAVQPVRNLLWWGARVQDAEPYQQATRPRTYRVYTSVDSIRLGLTLQNESPAPLAIDLPRFGERIGIRVQADRDVPVSLEWADTLRRAREPGLFPVDALQLDPGRGLDWAVSVRRLDGLPFEGEYDIHLNAEQILTAVTATDGSAWNGQALKGTVLHVIVRPPGSSAERAGMHRWLGFTATTDGRPSDALREFTAALMESPDDLDALVGLGDAYLMQNRYREAIDAYERVWPRLTQRNMVGMLLALAYVAVGDEQNARRVLRSSTGRSETDVTNQLQDLRERARRRPPR